MSLEFLLASGIALLFACGVYLVLRARTFPVVLGLSLMSYAVNLFIFAMGRLAVNAPPIVTPGQNLYADPLPQALVLTAIVIGFGMTGFLVELAVRARAETGTDHVDGLEPERTRARADRSHAEGGAEYIELERMAKPAAETSGEPRR